MRAITRTTITQETDAELQVRTQQIVNAADPKAKMQILWNNKPSRAFQEIREKLEAMATGRSRCMYCEDNLATKLFGLNDQEPPRKLPQARKGTLLKLQLLLMDYDQQTSTNPEEAAAIKRTIQDEPFSAILCWLIHITSTPAGPLVLRPGIPEIVERHGVAGW